MIDPECDFRRQIADGYVYYCRNSGGFEPELGAMASELRHVRRVDSVRYVLYLRHQVYGEVRLVLDLRPWIGGDEIADDHFDNSIPNWILSAVDLLVDPRGRTAG